MRDDLQIDDDLLDDYDEEAEVAWEEAETEERYPWLEDEKSDKPGAEKAEKAVVNGYRDDDDDDRLVVPAKYQKALDDIRAKEFARKSYISSNGTNYHHLTELTDEHLPELDFLRYHNLFAARTANAYLKTPRKRPARRQLFGDLWLEGELMLLFADTGLGKSALAIQIGDAIAGGVLFEPFGITTEAQRVLYLDFELTDEQFAARYTDPDPDAHYEDTDLLFSQNLIRSPPRENPYQPEEFDNYYSFLIHSVTDTIKFSGARVVIVDNITWLSASTEHSAAAQRLMRTLVDLKNQLGLSIMVIAHTPKLRRGLPVELNHLQGSKMLANFADNIIGMGRSCTSNDLRYLKPLKQRNAAARFDEKCVPVFRLARDRRMLGFTFVDYEPESRHLDGLRGTALADAIRHDRMTRAIELSNAGDSFREIAEKLGVGIATVARYLHNQPVVTAEISKNADVCSAVFRSRASPTEQKSEFLNEEEVSDEI